ncbi:MAG: type II secretion system protein N [Desulfobacteraceae bacterium]
MKYLFTIINLILITTFLFFGVEGMYKILLARLAPPVDYVSRPAAAREVNEASGKDPLAATPRYQDIVKRNFFHAMISEQEQQKEKTDPRPQLAIETMEKTDLDLKLWGTVTGDEHGACAVIEDKKTNSQALYKIGDAIQSAVVRKILRHRVVLNNNGKDQILEMDMEDRISGPVKKTVPGPAENAENITLDRSLVNRSMENINTLMKQVRIRPHFSGGKPDGMLLYGIKNDSLFKKMGLRNGDIIMGVDGKKIRSVDDALALYQNLKNASGVDMQIKRRGRIKEINYNVQ